MHGGKNLYSLVHIRCGKLVSSFREQHFQHVQNTIMMLLGTLKQLMMPLSLRITSTKNICLNQLLYMHASRFSMPSDPFFRDLYMCTKLGWSILAINSATKRFHVLCSVRLNFDSTLRLSLWHNNNSHADRNYRTLELTVLACPRWESGCIHGIMKSWNHRLNGIYSPCSVQSV